MMKGIFKVLSVLVLVAALFGAFDVSVSPATAGSATVAQAGHFSAVGVVPFAAADVCEDGTNLC